MFDDVTEIDKWKSLFEISSSHYANENIVDEKSIDKWNVQLLSCLMNRLDIQISR